MNRKGSDMQKSGRKPVWDAPYGFPAWKIFAMPFKNSTVSGSYREKNGQLLLNLECWKDIHPSLVTLPVEWNYTIPYGLLYPANNKNGSTVGDSGTFSGS